MAATIIDGKALADRDVFHLRRDDALARVVHLRDVLARDRAAWRAMQATWMMCIA